MNKYIYQKELIFKKLPDVNFTALTYDRLTTPITTEIANKINKVINNNNILCPLQSSSLFRGEVLAFVASVKTQLGYVV